MDFKGIIRSFDIYVVFGWNKMGKKRKFGGI